MIKLNCDLTEAIKNDFGSLWKCKQAGDTLEITTPYLLPDSTLFTVFITQRPGRYIVCDGGSISELLAESCPLPEEDITSAMAGLASRFRIKVGSSPDKGPLYFKDCDKVSLISSLVFDVASFAISATNTLIASEDGELETDSNTKFVSKANEFVRHVIPNTLEFHPRSEIAEVPGVRFSAVIKSTTKVWLVAYVTGNSVTSFRKNIAYTNMNFDHAWRSRVATRIGGTIPLINDEADGYKPTKLEWQLEDLKATSKESLVSWHERDNLRQLIA